MTGKKAKAAAVPAANKQSFWKKLVKQRQLLLLALPGVALVFIFKYIPIYGILIAFKDYRASAGVWGSEWLDPIWQNFTRFFMMQEQGTLF